MSRAPPSMKFTKKCKEIPNYEARAISFIIFTMKLLFGLDNETEHELSRCAEIINSRATISSLELPKMFVWDKWIKFIEYRKFIVKEFHFPSNFLYDNTVPNPELYVNFLKEQKEKHEIDDIFNVEYDVLRQLLLKLQQELPSKITFPISLTPFNDYIDAIKFYNELLPIVNEKFSHTTVDFLIRPYQYLKFASDNGKVRVIHHGKNTNWSFEKIKLYKTDIIHERKKCNQLYVVEMTNDLEDMLQQTEETTPTEEPLIDGNKIVNIHRKLHKNLHAKNITKVQEISKGTILDDINMETVPKITESYNTHYYPYERYWLRSEDVTFSSKERFDDFLNKFPYSFRLLFHECARIIEQPEKELFVDYNNVEIYLSYVAKYTEFQHCRSKSHFNEDLNKLVQKAKVHW